MDAIDAIKGWLGDGKKLIFGDPEALQKSYDNAMNMSRSMGQESKNFLMGQEDKALKFYAPMQQMFQNMYGTQGIQGPQTPRAPGAR